MKMPHVNLSEDHGKNSKDGKADENLPESHHGVE